MDEIREHYEVEKELAQKLRAAGREERKELYRAVYDELFRRVPHHPQLKRKSDEASRKREAGRQVSMLRRFLDPKFTFLQIGPGDCEMAFMLAQRLKMVYAVDVSEEITRSKDKPANFELILSDGTSIPLPPASVDVAYSNQLMEHLHPDDALEQLRNIYNALKPGGVYICLTPNRILGPHDVSKYFDEAATGLHLKEYTTGELVHIFKQAGFTKVKALYDARGRLPVFPTLPVRVVEYFLSMLPHALARKISMRSPIGKIIGVRLAGYK